MKVAVIGGAGVFGSRLARMLRRDGHEVVIAGRDATKVQRLAQEIGATALVLDRAGDLSPLWATGIRAVVDAAGPFHAYGADPQRLARAAISAGVHYLDLADDAAFCAGISGLDPLARAAGVAVLSGVSSVPALSSAAVAALVLGMETVDTIDGAILPGNRAPRGRSVVDGILNRAGTSFDTVIDGRATPVRGWSDPALYRAAPGMIRRAWMIEVPDQRLFPDHFRARTVTFRAGLELGVMGWGLAALSWLRDRLGFGLPRWAGAVVRAIAVALAPFGTDAGGMVVSVTGRNAGVWTRRTWRMIVRQGDGPFVPGVAARALLRHPERLAAGAGPAIGVLTLEQAEAAMSDLAVTCHRDSQIVVPLFARVLGSSFARLPAEVQATHDHAGPRRFDGIARVDRGSGPIARGIAALFRFPAAASEVTVEVVKTPSQDGERWERRFGNRVFRSRLTAPGDRLRERFGLFSFDIGLQVVDGALHFPVMGGRVLGVALPRALLPQSIASETAEDGRFRFDVALHAPLGLGLIVRYRGWLAAAGSGR